MNSDLTGDLSTQGYWPAMAREFLEKRQYSRAIEICTTHLENEPDTLSGRIVLAMALYNSRQFKEAEEQFYNILRIDPDNIQALKYLGDLKFRFGDEYAANSFYSRVLKLDPYTRGLKSAVAEKTTGETKILTLKRDFEESERGPERLRQLPFKTETAGDLLLAQGHTRLANEIFRELAEKTADPRLYEKLQKINAIKKDSKEHLDV